MVAIMFPPPHTSVLYQRQRRQERNPALLRRSPRLTDIPAHPRKLYLKFPITAQAVSLLVLTPLPTFLSPLTRMHPNFAGADRDKEG